MELSHLAWLQHVVGHDWRQRTPKEQDIAVGVRYLETTQAVIIVFQGLGKLDIA
jgi:hypothetical protein